MKQRKMEKPTFLRFGTLSPIKQKGFGRDSFHAPPAKKGIYAFVENHMEEFLLWGTMSQYGSENSKYESIKDKHGEKIYISSKIYDLINQEDSRLSFLGLEIEEEPRDKVLESVLSCKLFSKWIDKTKKNLDTFSQEDYSEWEGWLKKEVKKISGENKFYEHAIEDKDLYLLIKRVKGRKFSHVGELWHHLDPASVAGCVALQRHGSWCKTTYEDFCKLFRKEFSSTRKQWVNDPEAMADKDFWAGRTSFDHLEVFIEKVKES